MTVTKTKTELQGKLSEVMEYLTEDYAPLALMAKEFVCCMLLTEVDKLEFTPDVYDKVMDVNIKLSTDGDKVFLEILKEEKE